MVMVLEFVQYTTLLAAMKTVVAVKKNSKLTYGICDDKWDEVFLLIYVVIICDQACENRACGHKVYQVTKYVIVQY